MGNGVADGQWFFRKLSQFTASDLVSGACSTKSRLRARRLASACPMKCEAYFTGAASCKRQQLRGLTPIGLCNPLTVTFFLLTTGVRYSIVEIYTFGF
jgi:hypothetical protein